MFKALRSLILIQTGLTWKSFFKVVSAFTKVQEFILCKNNLSDTENVDNAKLDCLNEATYLNLEECEIKNFSSLSVFSKMPKLEKMTLNKNKLKQMGK